MWPIEAFFHIAAYGENIQEHLHGVLEGVEFGLRIEIPRDGYFEDFIQGVLAETIYDNEYDLEYSTQQYDYKRGRCEISVAVRCRAGDLYAQDKKADATSVDSALGAFELTVDTSAGTLTLK